HRRVRDAKADGRAAERVGDEVRRDRAEEPDEEGDGRQDEERVDVPALQPQDLEPGLSAALADLGQRRRFRRFPPPRFWPIRIGRCEAIAHATASASGTGIAMVSSYARREPSFLRIAPTSSSSPRRRTNSAGLSIKGLVIRATMRLRRSWNAMFSGCTLTSRMRPESRITAGDSVEALRTFYCVS